MYGPRWLGSWEGQSSEDICSSLTKVDAKQWTQIHDACEDLINRKIKASVIGTAVVATSLALCISFQALTNAFMNASVYKYFYKA